MINIQQLKEDLAELRLKVAELKIAKPQEVDGIEYAIFELKRDIVDKHSLMKVDRNIKSEMHKTNLFISDIERLIIANS